MRNGKYIFVILCMFSAVQLSGQLNVPDFRSLSISPSTNEVVLIWNTPDAAENILLHEISRKPYSSADYFFTPIATVPIPDTVFAETVPNLETQRQAYRIRSKNNLDTSPISDMHLTMQFFGEYNQCNNDIKLRWTPYRRYYIDQNGQIDITDLNSKKYNDAIEYEVWGHYGASFDIAQAIKLSDRSKVNTDIVIDNLITGTQYFLFVKALLPTGDTATSHKIEISTANKRFPSVINIDSVVSSRGEITLHINVDKTTQLDTFAIYRSDNSRFPLEWYYSPADIPSKFTDKTVSIGQVYHYYIVGRLCGKPIVQSDTVSNILLHATPYNLSAEIRWTEFFNESNTPTYTLHHVPSNVTIDPGNSLYFIDESTFDSVCKGPKKFCYVMTAETSKSSARSEQACVSLNAIITMPEAIDPMSDITATKNCNCSGNCTNHRRLFGPVMDMDDDAYQLEIEIFDRSGIQIFRSKKGFKESLQKEYHYWDGKYKNQYVSPGVYVYFTRIEFLNSEPVTTRGSVTVVMK